MAHVVGGVFRGYLLKSGAKILDKGVVSDYLYMSIVYCSGNIGCAVVGDLRASRRENGIM